MQLVDLVTQHFFVNRLTDHHPIGCSTAGFGNVDGRRQIAKVMRDKGYSLGVEIGVRRGNSCLMWLEDIPNLKLVGIDPYVKYDSRTQEDQDETYARAMKTAVNHGFEIRRKSSMEAVGEFDDESIDFVNIDGLHDFDSAAMDLICWGKKVREGGMILIHDYCTNYSQGVMKAVDAYTQCHGVFPLFVTRDREPTAFWEKGCKRDI